MPTTTTTQQPLLAPSSKLESPRRWLQRQLRKTAARQTTKHTEDNHAETDRTTSPPAPTIPIELERNSRYSSAQPPPRPPRPDPGVMRDISAWLDASVVTSSPPLMGGLSYWRTATMPGTKDSAGVQHAIPIAPDMGKNRSSIAHNQQARSFRRRAKKVHVKMPSLLRTQPRRLAAQNLNRQSASMPILAIPYETMHQAAPPILLGHSGNVLPATARPFTANAAPAIRREPVEHRLQHMERPASVMAGQETNMGRRGPARFPWTSRSCDSTRPSTVAAGRGREDSMGDLSDAPTYFSGPPPPSYRSRAASVMTSSSFGCVDGMGPAQRQISHQRGAQRRGVRGKLERLAHNLSAQ